MDRQQMERCLEQVAAYRASGQTAQVWGQANDVPMQALRGWCAQSRLDGVGTTPAKPVGFVIAQVGLRPVAAAASVRGKPTPIMLWVLPPPIACDSRNTEDPAPVPDRCRNARSTSVVIPLVK